MVEQSEDDFLEELMKASAGETLTVKQVSEMASRHGTRDYEAQNLRSFYLSDRKGPKVCVGLPCKLAGKAGDHGVSKGAEEVSCLGYCDRGPVMYDGGKYFHIENGGKMEISEDSDRKTTRNLSEYLEKGGFLTLTWLIDHSTWDNVRKFAKDFSLEGFGGSGFPAWVKWNAVAESGSDTKYLVVNAHEGEPGTFKDRVIMETRPFELIEAAVVTAMAVGAQKIVIALKHEYTDAERILQKALESSISYFGEKLGGKSLPKVMIKRIPGYYITGEESALLEAIEGRRSEPRLRPPYPAEVGLLGKPTLIDNVETLVYFLSLLKAHYAGLDGKQDKAYCVTGDVGRPGAYFMSYGTESGSLLKTSASTSINDLKAILPGGLSGGVLPAAEANVKLDFTSVRKAGAGMGTGSIIAVGKDRCMVDVIDSVEAFFARESCGKCIPCRLGTAAINKLFSDLKEGAATPRDLERAEETARVMIKGSICGLGQAAGKMFLDTMKNFSEEVRHHTEGKCDAGVCFEGVSH